MLYVFEFECMKKLHKLFTPHPLEVTGVITASNIRGCFQTHISQYVAIGVDIIITVYWINMTAMKSLPKNQEALLQPSSFWWIRPKFGVFVCECLCAFCVLQGDSAPDGAHF